MKKKKAVIYYFSGTGNSYKAATIIAKKLGGAQMISVTNPPEDVSAADADIIGFVSPVYEWDIPGVMKEFLERLTFNPNAYIFAISTYVFIHGKSFETIENILQRKGAHISYGKGIYCVASQCTAYTPFPSPKIMLPVMEKQFKKAAREIAQQKKRNFPHMSFITRNSYDKRMQPYMEIEEEFDKGFYTSDECAHCGICEKVCPLGNIKMVDGNPTWHNEKCHGCMACAAYCPKKAVLFKAPEAYMNSGMKLAKSLKLDEKRKRYHHPDVSVQDIIKKNHYVE